MPKRTRTYDDAKFVSSGDIQRTYAMHELRSWADSGTLRHVRFQCDQGSCAAGAATLETFQDERYAAPEDHVPSAYGTDHGTRPAAEPSSGYRSATDYRFDHGTGADTRRAAAAFSTSTADFQATTMGSVGAAVGAAAYKAEYSPFNTCTTEPCEGLPAVTIGSDTVEAHRLL
jgi:hypothetical protein